MRNTGLLQASPFYLTNYDYNEESPCTANQHLLYKRYPLTTDLTYDFKTLF